MFSPEFYRCNTCGNTIWIIEDSTVPIVCCGEPMTRLKANESDGDAEKHVPESFMAGKMLNVVVGSVMHPGTAAHHIEWIALQTEDEMFFKEIHVGDPPVADFYLTSGTPVAVYAYCNLHGLWKGDVK